MKKIIRFETENPHSESGVDVWTVIDKVPEGWIIWPVGEQYSPDGYIPIVRPIGNYSIDRNDLRAIRSDHVKEIMAASSWVTTLKEAEEFLNNSVNVQDFDLWKGYEAVWVGLPYMRELWEGKSDE